MINKYTFEKINDDSLNIQEFNSFRNKPVFTTIPWINFVKDDSKAEPLYIRISKEGKFIGYFTGLATKKIGIKIIGSPFRGWSTCYMGIDTDYPELKMDIYEELVPFLFKSEKCQYIEINDRDISVDEAKKRGITAYPAETLELEIDKDDAGLFKQMKTDCRNFIRQFERRGAHIEFAEPDDAFADNYYLQLQDVFAKQNLVPTYSVIKVKKLLKALKDTGELLCLRVISPDDRCIASSIFLGHKEKFFFWGGASYRPDQHFRPNEYMIWSAIKYWRDRGVKCFDMVGARDYKRKFGSYDQQYANMHFSNPKVLIIGRFIAEKIFFMYISVKGRILHKH